MTGRPGATPLRVGLACLGVYLATLAGHPSSPDEEAFYHQTRALVAERRLTLPAEAADTAVRLLPAAGGRWSSPYGLGVAAVLAPGYVLGDIAARAVPEAYREWLRRIGTNLADPLLTAATAALLTWLAASLGYAPATAAALGLGFGLATIAWPYARYLWSEPMSATFLLAATCAARRSRTGPGRGALAALAAGGLAAFAAAVKPSNALLLPGLALYLGWPEADSRARRALRLVALSLLPIVGAAVMLWLNRERFGAALVSGYRVLGIGLVAFGFQGGRGLAGLLLSPAKSVFLYSPPLVAALLAFPAFARRHRREAALVAYACLSQWLLFGTYLGWHGDASWGPRYLVPVTALGLLPAAAWIEAGGARRILVGALAAAGVALQLPGVAVAYTARAAPLTGLPQADVDRLRWDWRRFPPADHVRILHHRLVRLRDRHHPSEEVVLARGFEPPESAAPFPRWTGAEAELIIRHREAAAVRLETCDYRPAGLPPAPVEIRLDATAVAADRGPGEHPWCQVATISIPPPVGAGEHRLTLTVAPWVPSRVFGSSDRRSLGVSIASLRVESGGREMPRRDRTIPLLPVAATSPWNARVMTWFYEPPHPLDVWWWFVVASGAGRGALLLLLVPLALIVLAWRLPGAGRFGPAGERHERTMRL